MANTLPAFAKDRVIESSRHGIAVFAADRPEYPVLYANPAFETLTGYSAEKAAGRNPFLVDDGRHENGPELEKIRLGLRERRECRAILRNLRGDGAPAWIEVLLEPVRAGSGEPTRYLAFVHDGTALEACEGQPESRANRDPLTGIPGRPLLDERLNEALDSARRNARRAGVLLMGLDNFGYVNEGLGYGGGDRALKAFAERLAASVRETDTVARLGGDEFAVVLSSVESETEVESFIRKLLGLAAQPYRIDGQELFLGFSVGASLYPGDGKQAETLLRNAGLAMRRAKEREKGRYAFHARESDNAAPERLILKSQLHRALERSELVLYYQPQIDLGTRQITGVETLIRWQHPDRGLLAPADFIPLAEDTGLMDPIGEWLIATACGQNKAWQKAGLPPLQLAVNISSRQFRQKSFFEVVARALKQSRLEARYLDLEITERMMMHDLQTSAEVLEKLKILGVRLSVDNFGTWYSSLNDLKRFPMDSIKIDKRFVQGATVHPDDAAIVKATIDMSHKLGLRVIAEGVETEGQLGFLTRHGCDGAQGFIFSPALPAEDFVRFIRRNWHFPPGTRENRTDQRTLLIVDDEPNVRSALARLLRGSGYRILTADGGRAGLELLAINRVGVILSDHRMPGMTGIEFLKRVKELHPNVVRILLSGFIDVQVVTDAINEGAVYKFLAKPWEDGPLRNTIREAFELFETSDHGQHARAGHKD